MLTHPTLEHLRQLKLDGMADAFAEMSKQDDAADLSHAEWLGLLVEREIASRNTRRFQTRMRSAKLRHIGAAIEDVDFRTPRKLDRTQFQQLATGRWIDDARNLMITGPCGVGKTWLACALGQRACRDNLTVIYHRLPRLFADLELAHGRMHLASLRGLSDTLRDDIVAGGATAIGVRTAHLNQPVELASLRPAFARFLGISGGRPDLVIRFGRGREMPRSLRRPLESVLL